MIRCLVITHGRLGDELLYNVEAILGPIEGMQSMTNQGQSARDLVSAVSDWLAAALADKQAAPPPPNWPRQGGCRSSS
jgi:mannose/fructose-specific phosphotransferase system component IIA